MTKPRRPPRSGHHPARRRAQFVREAIKKAVREAEYARIRQAYAARPDSEAEADDWSSAETYEGPVSQKN